MPVEIVARRRSPPKNPRQGPGHNAANKQTRESRQQTRMLDGGHELRFKYFMEQILIEEGGMEPENARPVIQFIWARGARQSTTLAYEFLEEKVKDGMVPESAHQKCRDLIKKYTRWR